MGTDLYVVSGSLLIPLDPHGEFFATNPVSRRALPLSFDHLVVPAL